MWTNQAINSNMASDLATNDVTNLKSKMKQQGEGGERASICESII